MSHWSQLLLDAVDFGDDPAPEHIHPKGWDGEPDCPACYVDTIRMALRGYYDEPEPTIGEAANPCDHEDAAVGYVQAGDPKAERHCSIYTCAACVVASQGYVQAVTNLPASGLIPFDRKVVSE